MTNTPNSQPTSEQQELRERHTVVIFPEDGGLAVECAWCDQGLGWIPSSAPLEDLNGLAESHWAEGAELERQYAPRS